jgi:hypothetical protein
MSKRVRTSTRLALVAALAGAALIPVACGGNKPEPNASASFSFGGDAGSTPQSGQPCAPGQPCPPPPNNCVPGAPCPTANNPPATGTPPPANSACPPGQQCNPLDPNLLAGLLGAASAFLQPMGVGDPVEMGIKAAAVKYAPGMTPEGQIAKGNVQAGGHVQFIVNMDASHCYTIVGYGAGLQDLDLNLLAPPLYNISAGTDGMAGPTAVIGASPKPLCPAIPVAVPYKVDIYAKAGAGPVGAQVYSKPK